MLTEHELKKAAATATGTRTVTLQTPQYPYVAETVYLATAEFMAKDTAERQATASRFRQTRYQQHHDEQGGTAL